uniref:Uncharacterized protein n=1 Tax=Cyclophora tenuis TaxID=216820 RepID=A0A7S1D8N8_CYCTE|mmetsp:Transcript_4365/g.7547  ORF Transcript_4365/g.7547 Transcript_4365/m.7547 type:complete len:148 (+) Transcript_4365:55-498(+)
MRWSSPSLLALLLSILLVQPFVVEGKGWIPTTKPTTCRQQQQIQPEHSFATNVVTKTPRGGWSIVPAGWNPFGYKITPLGEKFLSFEGSLDHDVGRLLSSLKTRKRFSTLKAQWLEVLRNTKAGQSMRIYRILNDLVDFCLKAGLID